MSLILDALRRAERGRTRDLGQRLSQALPPRARRGQRWTLLLVAAGVATVMVAVAALWPRATRTTPPPEPVVTIEPTTPVERRAPAGSSLAQIPVPEPDAAPMPTGIERAPLFQELPVDMRAAIPDITLDAHFWSPEPERRFVMVAMNRYRAGDRMSNGLRVNAVLPEGVELEWRGTRFRILAQ